MAEPVAYSNATYKPPVGYAGNLNEAQQQAYNELRARLKVHFDAHRSEFKDDHEARFDDVRLTRFLRARQYNVDKALEMIVTDINWRDQIDVKRVLETFPTTPAFQQLYEYWPAREHSKDKFGIVSWWERIALVDVKTFVENVKHEDLLHFHIVTQEANERRFFAVRDGIRFQEGGTFVLDMTGLGLKHLNSAGMGLIKELSSMDEAHYPEMIRKIYITNAPSIFGMFYRVISPWLDKHTAEKIDVISHPKEVLGAEFGLENLPAFVGGNSPTNIPNGGTFKGLPSETSSFETAVVKDYFEIEMNIEEGEVFDPIAKLYSQGSMIGWNFAVESHDLGFAIYFTPKGAAEQERRMVQEYARLATNEGSIVADQCGKYIFHWDNSFSLWRKKAMQYQLSVEPPLSSSGAPGEGRKVLTQSTGGKDGKDKKSKKDKGDKKKEKKEKKDKKDKKHKRTPSTS